MVLEEKPNLMVPFAEVHLGMMDWTF